MTVQNGLKSIMHTEKDYIQQITGKRIGIQAMKVNLAEYCGVSYHNIEQMYKGASLPSLPVALRIAKYFRVNVEQIFSLKLEEESK